MTEDEERAEEEKKQRELEREKAREFKCAYSGHWIKFRNPGRNGRYHFSIENHTKIPNWPQHGMFAELQQEETCAVRFGIAVSSGVLWLDPNWATRTCATPEEAWHKALAELARYTEFFAGFSFVPVLTRLGISKHALLQKRLAELEKDAGAERARLSVLEAEIAKVLEALGATDPA